MRRTIVPTIARDGTKRIDFIMVDNLNGKFRGYTLHQKGNYYHYIEIPKSFAFEVNEVILNHLELYANVIDYERSSEHHGMTQRKRDVVGSTLRVIGFRIGRTVKDDLYILETNRLDRVMLTFYRSDLTFIFPTVYNKEIKIKDSNNILVGDTVVAIKSDKHRTFKKGDLFIVKDLKDDIDTSEIYGDSIIIAASKDKEIVSYTKYFRKKKNV